MKKAKVDGKLRDIISSEDYYNNQAYYNKNKQIAVQWGDNLYPIRNRFDSTPGVYNTNVGTMFIPPKKNDKNYLANNIIDFDSVKTMAEMIEKNNTLKDIEKDILTTDSNNICIPNITDRDTPEMRVLKEAIIEKHIDLDKYEDRFNGNYSNDRRILLKDRISFSKLRDMLNILDIKGTLVLEDANSEVPNPMGKTLSIEITSSNSGDEQDD